MKIDQKGFTLVEGLLAIIALCLILGLGFSFYTYSTHQNEKNSGMTPRSASTQKEPTTTEDKAQKSDKELIIEAMEEAGAPTIDGSKQPVSSVEVSEIIENNAKGTAEVEGASGFTFIAHKADNTWSIVFRGQELPGQEVGIKYSLPQNWYSSEY